MPKMRDGFGGSFGKPKAKRAMKPLTNGLIASLVLLTIYFLLLSLISGPAFALSQFTKYWYFILGLSFGFGIQIGLYTRLRQLIVKGGAGIMAVTGTTSTVAMVSCCSHYLVNILPIVGTVGVLTIISEYQIEFFWVGLIANLAGILYLTNKLRKISK